MVTGFGWTGEHGRWEFHSGKLSRHFLHPPTTDDHHQHLQDDNEEEDKTSQSMLLLHSTSQIKLWEILELNCWSWSFLVTHRAMRARRKWKLCLLFKFSACLVNFMRSARWVCSNHCEVSFLRRLFLSVNSKLFTAKTHMETDYLYKDSQMNFTCIQTGRGSHWLRCSPSLPPRWPEQSPRSRRKRSRGTWRCAKLNKFISVIDAREGKGLKDGWQLI